MIIEHQQNLLEIKQAIKTPPLKRKYYQIQIIFSFIKKYFLNKYQPNQQIQNITKFYKQILSYHLQYALITAISENLQARFVKKSIVFILKGSIQKITQINPHKRIFNKKQMIYQQPIIHKQIIEQGTICILEADSNIKIINNQDFTQIIWLSLSKFQDAEVIKNKSIKQQTDFLKNTLFWNKFQIQQLKTIIFKTSHKKYKRYDYIYKAQQNVNYVYLVREGQFIYQKSLPIYGKVQYTKQLPIIRVSVGEILGYNQILQQKKKRQYNLQCVSLVGQLYIFPLQYWYQIYRIFKNQLNQVKSKSQSFNKHQIINRVKSLQNNLEYLHLPMMKKNTSYRQISNFKSIRNKKQIQMTLNEYLISNLNADYDIKKSLITNRSRIGRSKTQQSQHQQNYSISSFDVKKQINFHIKNKISEIPYYQLKLDKFEKIKSKKQIIRKNVYNPFQVYKNSFKSTLIKQRQKVLKRLENSKNKKK